MSSGQFVEHFETLQQRQEEENNILAQLRVEASSMAERALPSTSLGTLEVAHVTDRLPDDLQPHLTSLPPARPPKPINPNPAPNMTKRHASLADLSFDASHIRPHSSPPPPPLHDQPTLSAPPLSPSTPQKKTSFKTKKASAPVDVLECIKCRDLQEQLQTLVLLFSSFFWGDVSILITCPNLPSVQRGAMESRVGAVSSVLDPIANGELTDGMQVTSHRPSDCVISWVM